MAPSHEAGTVAEGRTGESKHASAPGWVQAIRQLLEMTRITSISLATAVLATAVLLGTSQSLEALRVLGEGLGDAKVHFVTTELAVVLLATMLWYSARVAVYALAREAMDDESHPTRRRAANIIPRLCGALPPAALAAACFLARRVPDPIGDANAKLVFLGALNAGVALLFLLLVSVRGKILHRQPYRSGVAQVVLSVEDLEPVTRRIFEGMLVLWAIFLLWTLATFGMYAERLGVLATVMVCLATWAPVGTLILYWGARRDFPAVKLLFAWVLLLALIGVPENHRVTQDESGLHPAALLEFATRWYGARPDKGAYAGKAYPVFIVAADGGGIRNAYLTASVLELLEKACPRFQQHLFAISAVSGGSIGAAVYRAGLRDWPREADTPGTCDFGNVDPTRDSVGQARVEHILSRDLLSPVIASLLYSEALQKFVPLHIPRSDRARALENATSRAYETVLPKGTSSPGLDASFYSFTEPKYPLLFFNTTSVTTGRAMVVAGAKPAASRFTFETLDTVNHTASVRLNTAAVMSARFPFVTPEAVVANAEGKDQRFVDGGYFDNSGATTALAIAQALALDTLGGGAMRFQPVIVHIGVGDSTLKQEAKGRKRWLSVGFHEILEPVRALFAIRASRGGVVVSQLIEQASLGEQHIPVIDISINEGKVPFVVGWLMSRNARIEIQHSLSTTDSASRSKRLCDYAKVQAILGYPPPTSCASR